LKSADRLRATLRAALRALGAGVRIRRQKIGPALYYDRDSIRFFLERGEELIV